jgi:hypothetical protein
MAEFKCPNCDTLTERGDPRFPFCRSCREFLLKCRNCTHLIAATWECSHPRVSRGEFMEYSQTSDYKHIPDIDDVHQCRYHRSGIVVLPMEPGAAGWGRRILRLGAGPLIIIALLLIGTGQQLYKWRLSQLANLQIQVTAPDSISLNDQVPFRIEVLNPREKRRRMDISIRIPEKFFEQFQPVSVNPAPSRVDLPAGLGDSRTLHFRNMDTSQAISITLVCLASKQGFKKYHFTLYTGDVRQSDELLTVGVM